jgi:hypothetical protein
MTEANALEELHGCFTYHQTMCLYGGINDGRKRFTRATRSMLSGLRQ